MKNTIALFLFFVLGVVSIAFASSVTTNDGELFNVTNDGGFTSPMTMQEINQTVSRSEKIMRTDSVKFLADQETYVVWSGVEKMAQDSLTQWQSNQAK